MAEFALGVAQLGTEVDTSGLNKGLDDAEGQAKGRLSKLGDVLGGALKIGLVGAAVGIGAIGAAVASGIGDAREAQQLLAQTQAVITSTGAAAGKSATEITDLATALSASKGKSLFGDSDVQAAENLLLTFTNIKGAVFDAATTISVDMAQALGGAPKDQAIALGKALNDPIAGVTALSRVGVTFTEEQKKQIKVMQEAGNMAGAQTIILNELNKEFGGSAEAAAKADGGWAQFQDRLGEAEESIGAALLPLLTTLVGFLNDSIMPAIDGVVAFFDNFIKSVQIGAMWTGHLGEVITTALTPVLGEQLAGVVGSAVDMFQNLLDIWEQTGDFTSSFPERIGAMIDAVLELLGVISGVEDGFTPFQDIGSLINTIVPQIVGLLSGDLSGALSQTGIDFGAIFTTIQGVMDGILAVVGAVLVQVAAFWQSHGAEIMAFAKQAWDGIAEIINLAVQIINATIVPALAAIAGFIAAHGAEIQGYFEGTWNIIKGIVEIAIGLVKGILKTVLALIQGDWQGAWDAIKEMVATVWEGIKTVISGAVEVVKSVLSLAWAAIGGKITEAWEGIKRTVATAWDNIQESIETAKSNIISTLEALPGKMVQIGGDIIGGILSGLRDNAQKILDYLASLADQAIQAFKDAIFSDSPSRLFAEEGGEPIILGIIAGMEAMMPDLLAAISGISDDLTSEAEKLAERVVNALADGLDASAAIDRQKERNLEAIGKFASDIQSRVTDELSKAEAEAGQIQDPEEAKKYFAMRSRQILELADLEQKLRKAQTSTETDQLLERMKLLREAQAKEQAAFQQRQGLPSSSPTQSLIDAIQKFFLNPDLPGLGEDPTGMLQHLFDLWQQLSNPTPPPTTALPALIPAGTGAALTSGASSLVRIVLDPGGSELLRQLIRVEIRNNENAQGRLADTLRRTR